MNDRRSKHLQQPFIALSDNAEAQRLGPVSDKQTGLRSGGARAANTVRIGGSLNRVITPFWQPPVGYTWELHSTTFTQNHGSPIQTWQPPNVGTGYGPYRSALGFNWLETMWCGFSFQEPSFRQYIVAPPDGHAVFPYPRTWDGAFACHVAAKIQLLDRNGNPLKWAAVSGDYSGSLHSDQTDPTGTNVTDAFSEAGTLTSGNWTYDDGGDDGQPGVWLPRDPLREWWAVKCDFTGTIWTPTNSTIANWDNLAEVTFSWLEVKEL